MAGLAEILADIHALEKDLLELERRYGLRSETFYAAYIIGEEPDLSIRRIGEPGDPVFALIRDFVRQFSVDGPR